MAQYRSDVKKTDSIEAAHEHGKFTIIERIEKEMEPNALRIFMEQRKDFWMSRLKTIYPH